MENTTNILQDDLQEDILKMRRKLDSFMALLAHNDICLQVIAELEDKAGGDDPFEQAFLRLNIEALISGVMNILEELKVICEGKYSELNSKLLSISNVILDELSKKKEIPPDDFCVRLSEISRNRVESVGGKNAHIGELGNVLGLPVPDGFAVTAWAYRKFIEAGDLHDEIRMRLDAVDVHDFESTKVISAEIRERILSMPLPMDIENAIRQQCDILAAKGIGRVSVRSSAIDEGAKYSFAGQYMTFLNVPLDEVPKKYMEVVASKFAPTALFYLINKGFVEEEIAMSVCCMEMLEASSSGVMQTTDQTDPAGTNRVISSLWGLGIEMLHGTLPPDHFIIRKSDGAIIEARIARKDFMVVRDGDSGIVEVETPDDKKNAPSLSNEIINRLVDYASILENHYKAPQEVEWAVDSDGKLFLLQSRPIRISHDDSKEPIKEQIRIDPSRKKLFQGGEVACAGTAYGSVFKLDSEKNLTKTPNGCILITRNASPMIVSVMTRVRGIVTEVGSPTGHMASLAREFMIPTLVNAGEAVRYLESGAEVTLDSGNRIIYEGRVPELMDTISRSRRGFFSDTPVYGMLERVLKHIGPLNLVDPESGDFTSDNCRTLHDIVRFSHQKAMACMFTLAEQVSKTAKIATKLKTDIPIEVYLLDLGGGICESHSGELVLPEDICSIPMISFWKGLTEAKWPAPQPPKSSGSKSVIAGTIADPELKQRLKEKTLAIITKTFMNFNLHLGYHLSAVEGLATNNPRDNYARLYFQGGGATQERRIRRVRLVVKILEHYGFDVYWQVDMLTAIYSVCTKEDLGETMRMLGHLIGYTKQLDMVMFNDDIVDWFVEEFLKGNYNR